MKNASVRRKRVIQYIREKSSRKDSFYKRKTGILKKAEELATLSGSEVLILVVSEGNHCYKFSTEKLNPLLSSKALKNRLELMGVTNFEISSLSAAPRTNSKSQSETLGSSVPYLQIQSDAKPKKIFGSRSHSLSLDLRQTQRNILGQISADPILDPFTLDFFKTPNLSQQNNSIYYSNSLPNTSPNGRNRVSSWPFI